MGTAHSRGGAAGRRCRRLLGILGVGCIAGLLSLGAHAYTDEFTSAPAGNGSTTITTGSASTGLEYAGTNCDFVWDDTHDEMSSEIFVSGSASFTITSRDDKAFVFQSIYIDNLISQNITITGSGPEPFTITAPGSTDGTYSPGGGDKHVTEVVISNQGGNDFFMQFDTTTVDLDVPGAAIKGNGQLISNGDTTPSLADDTNMGATSVGTPIDKTFTIESIGDASLDLTGSPYVTVSNTTDFAVQAQPTTDPIASGASDTFTIRFSPASNGVKTATVTLRNNSEADPYTFMVLGDAAGEPEIDVQRPAGAVNSIADGGTDAQGSKEVGTQVTLTYTVENTGDASLSVTNISSTAASGVSVDSISPTTLSIGASSSDTFAVKYTPTAVGAFSFELDIANDDDPPEDNYDITVSGTGVDTDPPDVSSIVRADADPTNAGAVDFTVTFDESVSGVDTTDFSLDVSGIAGASIGVISGSGTTYTVPVNTGGGDGTLSIDLVDDDSIEDGSANKLGGTGAGNGNYTAGETYTIDKTPPSVPDGLDPANNAYVNTGTPTFSWDASTDTGGSGLRTTNTYHYDIDGPTPKDHYTANTNYTPLAALADGTYTWRICSRDNAGNNSDWSTTNTLTVDTDAPGLDSFERKTPGTSPTNADTLVFLVTFDEDVQSVDPGDFTEDGASGATISVSQVTASTYDVTLSGGTLANHNGVVGIDLVGAPTIEDPAGNGLPAGEPTTDETYTVDNDVPGVTSFERKTPATSPTNADTLVFLVTFDEDVQNVDPGDFTENGASGATISVSQVTASTYDVTLSGGTLASHNGVVGIDLVGSPTIEDLAGNGLPAGEPTTDEAYTVDNDPPAVSTVTASPTTIVDATWGTDTFTVTVVFDEMMATGTTPSLVFVPDVVGGGTPTLSNGSGSWSTTTHTDDTFTMTYDVADRNIDIDSVTIDVTGAVDLAGNGQEDHTPVHEFDIDTLNPWMSSITSMTPNGYYGAGAAIDITMNFSENVTMTGAPKVDLDSGASGVLLGVASGAASTNGTYTVGAGENSCDLDVSSVTVPGIPTDMAGNGMDWTKSIATLDSDNLADNKDITVDTTDPAITWVQEFPAGTQNMDADCTLEFSIGVRVTDNCCIDEADVTYTLTPSANVSAAAVWTRTQVSETRVDYVGTVTVKNLANCPATVDLEFDATDCSGNAMTTSSDSVTVADISPPTHTWITDFPDVSQSMDDDCSLTFPIEVLIEDNCCIDAANVVIAVSDPGDVTVANTLTKTQEGANAVRIAGDVTLSALTDGRATVLLTAMSTDCCGNVDATLSDSVTVVDEALPTMSGFSVTPDDGLVDDNCEEVVTVSAVVRDNCCLDAGSVIVTPTVTNATLKDNTIAATQNGPNEVLVSGTIVVRSLTGCPATLEIAIDASDCGGNGNTWDESAEIRDDILPAISVLRVDEHVVLDECCEAIVTFDGTVEDNCCVHADGITITVTNPTGNATVTFDQATDVQFTQCLLGQVDFSGEIAVRCVTSCPAIVQVTVNANDCCGNAAVPVSSTADPNDPNDTGHVYDETDPIPRDDPRQDMVLDESAIIDPLVEVRLDEFGVYRLVMRENTPVRIDVLANDADSCSCEDCDHPFDPCGGCGACPGCCAAIFLHEIVSAPAYGTVTIEDAEGDCGGGTVVRYAPDQGRIGPDEFTYRTRDACGNVSTEVATVRLYVASHVTMEDVSAVACSAEPVAVTVTAYDVWADVDPDEIPFGFTIVSGPSHGVLAVDVTNLTVMPPSSVIVGGRTVPTLDVSESVSITMAYTSAVGFAGRDMIRVRFSDPFGNEVTANVDILVIECVVGEIGIPGITVSQGTQLKIIVPEAFESIADTAWASVLLLSLEDGTGYSVVLSVVFNEEINRYVITVDTGPVPAGRYLLSIPLGNGETVELTIEVRAPDHG